VRTITKLWILLAILIALTPLGILLPAHFKSGAAWGEWGLDEIKSLVGYIPKGLAKLSSIWNAPIPDYASGVIGYIASAITGIAVVSVIIFLIGKLLSKKD
jgi:hypothetical protein